MWSVGTDTRAAELVAAIGGCDCASAAFHHSFLISSVFVLPAAVLQNTGDGAVAPPSSRGVLHGALLKDVMAASKNSAGSTMEFVFRIGSAGVTPNPL